MPSHSPIASGITREYLNDKPIIVNPQHGFKLALFPSAPEPQKTIYAAMHQCYSEGFVAEESLPDERKAGELVVKHLLSGNRGHYGPIEEGYIVLNAGGFPHDTMQQLRTHRHLTMDVQSGRYTGNRILEAARRLADAGDDEWRDIVESVVYLRPAAEYRSREGITDYTNEIRELHLAEVREAIERYHRDVGVFHLPKEHARQLFPFGIRQNWMVGMTFRTAFHVLDVRAKPDVQFETKVFAEMLFELLMLVMPEITAWYHDNRLGKAILSP